jgi:uncharacterized protein (DUF2267 family)
LETLGERLSGGAVEKLSAQLSPELAAFLEDDVFDNGQRFGLEEFFERVAERADIEEDEARGQSRAVLEVVCECISAKGQEWLISQLPSQYERLFAAGVATIRRGAFAAYDEDEEDEEE